MATVSNERLSTKQFVEQLEQEVRRGFSVIPLVGSGVSAPSGVLTGEAFGDYLLCCVWDALRDPKPPAQRKIDLRNGIWAPPPYTEEEIGEAKTWMRKLSARLFTRRSKRLSPLEQEALGSLANWRSTLLFLSRLHESVQPGSDVRIRELVAPRPFVVDSFNYYITRGHTPNLGHQMLAFLTRLLRIRTVLTTNFDSLLERAFAEAHFPIEVFDVHLAGNLPHANLVRSQLSLVKLHGSRFETRADYSLDAVPSPQDLEAFRVYFSAQSHLPPAHLLVLGFSGQDKRIMSFIRDLVRKSEQPVTVFWVCHRPEEVDGVRSRLGADVPGSRLVITSGRADLLLFELYHRFVTTVPPAGSSFEYSQYIPPNAVSFYNDRDAWADRLIKAISKREEIPSGCPLARLLIEPEIAGARGVAYTLDGVPGISDLAQSCYAKIVAKGRRALWFELDDFCNTADLAACILQTVAAQRGQLDFDVITLSLSSRGSKLNTSPVISTFERMNGRCLSTAVSPQAPVPVGRTRDGSRRSSRNSGRFSRN